MDPSDIISDLFARDLDLPLQTVFLSLDPISLKHCRLVCRQWDEFIKCRVWGNKKDSEPYSRLRHRLAFHWRYATPPIRSVELEVDSIVNCVSCDDTVVVCGMKDASAMVYDNFNDIDNLNIVADLDCRILLPSRPYNRRADKSDVQPDVGQEVVATVTEQGDVSVWKRSDWSNLYKKSHHGNRPIYAVKVLPDLIITGGCDGLLAVLSWDGEQVNLVRTLGENPPINMPTFQTPMDNPWHITHLDSDGEWVLVGTSMQLKVWRLYDNALVNSFDTSWINSLALCYPYCVVARNTYGMTVWDLRTGQEVRKVGEDIFWQIHHNGSILVGSIPNLPWATGHRQSTRFFSLKQMFNKDPKKAVWSRKKYLAPGETMVSACVNTSILVAAQGKCLHVWDFWNCDEFSDSPDPDFDSSEDDSSDEDDYYHRRIRL